MSRTGSFRNAAADTIFDVAIGAHDHVAQAGHIKIDDGVGTQFLSVVLLLSG